MLCFNKLRNFYSVKLFAFKNWLMSYFLALIGFNLFTSHDVNIKMLEL